MRVLRWLALEVYWVVETGPVRMAPNLTPNAYVVLAHERQADVLKEVSVDTALVRCGRQVDPDIQSPIRLEWQHE
jgi:hypothetical protein